jgi:hypothetical protein
MTVTTLLPQTELAKTKQQILAVLPPLKAEVDLLTITTEEDYQKASGLLTRILASKRWWLQGDQTGGKWKGIDAIIKPFREGLDGLYDLKNDGLKPHEEMETDVKAKMKVFKLAEAKRLADEQAAREAEDRRLQAEIEKKQAKEQAAKTVQTRERLIGQRMELEEQQKTVVRTKAAPVRAAGSAARTIKKPVVTNFRAFIMGILALEDETITIDLLAVNEKSFGHLWLSNPELVAQLPGVEIQTDVVIAGR